MFTYFPKFQTQFSVKIVKHEDFKFKLSFLLLAFLMIKSLTHI